MAITRDSCVDVEDLKSNQEEADTRMLLHAKYAAGQCQEAKIGFFLYFIDFFCC